MTGIQQKTLGKCDLRKILAATGDDRICGIMELSKRNDKHNPSGPLYEVNKLYPFYMFLHLFQLSF